MCNVCNKSKCCCTKTVSRTGPRGPKGTAGKDGENGAPGTPGVTGPAGAGFIQFIPIPSGSADESTITQHDSSPVTEAGDYIVILEANIEKVGVMDISFNSYIRKNGVNDTLNVNYQHLNRTSGLNCTHTHTGKVSLTVGQTAGIELAMGGSSKVLNGSVILSKISS